MTRRVHLRSPNDAARPWCRRWATLRIPFRDLSSSPTRTTCLRCLRMARQHVAFQLAALDHRLADLGAAP